MTKATVVNLISWTSNLSAKSNLVSLKAEVDEIGVDKLKTVPVDLSKLNTVADKDIVKKNLYVMLMTNVYTIDTCRFALKTQYNTDKLVLENKVNYGLVKKKQTK